MARTYKRDSRGRFAGGGGGSSGGRGGRPATKRVQRGTNRLTRDNSGKITGQGGSGATARGGRLKTAAGNQRATQLDRLKGRIGGAIVKNSSKRKSSRSEAANLRVSAAKSRKAAARDFNDGGNVVANKMSAKAARLDQISAHNKAQKLAAQQAERKRAKVQGSTGSRRDTNRLKTLNNRLKYYQKSGYTPDELNVTATRSARNALAASMLAKGGQRISVRTRSEAARAQRGRSALMLSAGNASARLNKDNGVSIQMQNGYGLRKVTERRSQARMFGNPFTYNVASAKQPGKTVVIPVKPGEGRRIKGRTVGIQGDLFSAGKQVKVFRPTAPRSRRR